MKKLLFAILLFTGIAAATPKAEAGQFARIYTNRGVAYVHKSQVYGGGYAPYAYNGGRRHHYHNNRARYVGYPYSRGYSRPSYYRGYSRPYYSDYSCGYRGHRSPRVAISFGF